MCLKKILKRYFLREKALYQYIPLVLAFFFVFLLSTVLSASWVTLSWVILGAVILSVGFLNICKLYRVCGLSVCALALARLFLVDLREMDTVYRVITFMVFGAILLGLSFIYSNLAARHE